MVQELETFYASDGLWKSFRGVTSNNPGVEVRDPIYRPYGQGSIWNMPIGQDADLINLGFNYLGDNAFANSRVCVEEENVLFLNPDAPLAYIMETNAAWNGSLTRCGARTGDILQGNGSVVPMPKLPIPTGWSTQPYIGTTPNMSGAVVYRDSSGVLRLFETQPLHLCDDGVAVSQYVNSIWVGDSIGEGGGMGAANADGSGGKGGSHGGSYMTAFGGTIRLGEVVPGGEIKHAMKLTMDTGWYCSNATLPSPIGAQGHRWPAIRADSGWAGSYGTLNPSVPPQAKMGMLLTTSNTFDPESLVTEPARIIARAFKNYGAYLVDGDFQASVPHLCQWQTERSNEGSFTQDFIDAWGYRFFHQPGKHGTPSTGQMNFRADIGNLMENAYIVNDNAPDNVGGAGTRRAPLASPMEA